MNNRLQSLLTLAGLAALVAPNREVFTTQGASSTEVHLSGQKSKPQEQPIKGKIIELEVDPVTGGYRGQIEGPYGEILHPRDMPQSVVKRMEVVTDIPLDRRFYPWQLVRSFAFVGTNGLDKRYGAFAADQKVDLGHTLAAMSAAQTGASSGRAFGAGFCDAGERRLEGNKIAIYGAPNWIFLPSSSSPSEVAELFQLTDKFGPDLDKAGAEKLLATLGELNDWDCLWLTTAMTKLSLLTVDIEPAEVFRADLGDIFKITKEEFLTRCKLALRSALAPGMKEFKAAIADLGPKTTKEQAGQLLQIMEQYEETMAAARAHPEKPSDWDWTQKAVAALEALAAGKFDPSKFGMSKPSDDELKNWFKGCQTALTERFVTPLLYTDAVPLGEPVFKLGGFMVMRPSDAKKPKPSKGASGQTPEVEGVEYSDERLAALADQSRFPVFNFQGASRREIDLFAMIPGLRQLKLLTFDPTDFSAKK